MQSCRSTATSPPLPEALAARTSAGPYRRPMPSHRQRCRRRQRCPSLAKAPWRCQGRAQQSSTTLPRCPRRPLETDVPVPCGSPPTARTSGRRQPDASRANDTVHLSVPKRCSCRRGKTTSFSSGPHPSARTTQPCHARCACLPPSCAKPWGSPRSKSTPASRARSSHRVPSACQACRALSHRVLKSRLPTPAARARPLLNHASLHSQDLSAACYSFSEDSQQF
mmetsp:Transcript_38834/g.111530  ORF Transcript_38834/g.111530 Transcript_38834/m.111530 type:complete len:224 (-) Transcript_38834:102-773(-)